MKFSLTLLYLQQPSYSPTDIWVIYFKQSAKSLEQKIAMEARFYGALIRLQQNWKVKQHRVAASASGNEGFTIDLFDKSLYGSAAVLQPSSLSTIRIDHDSAGMLAINLPPNSCCSFRFGFLGAHSSDSLKQSSEVKTACLPRPSKAAKESVSDDGCVRETHSLPRQVHQAIFYEQVFDLVNREAFKQSLGVNLILLAPQVFDLVNREAFKQSLGVNLILLAPQVFDLVNREAFKKSL